MKETLTALALTVALGINSISCSSYRKPIYEGIIDGREVILTEGKRKRGGVIEVNQRNKNAVERYEFIYAFGDYNVPILKKFTIEEEGKITEYDGEEMFTKSLWAQAERNFSHYIREINYEASRETVAIEPVSR